MLKIDLYNQKGEKKGHVDAPESLFGVDFNGDLIHLALVRQHANARLGVIAHTKTKGEVSGRGERPFRQKGTGKARQGNLRNPHFTGGGVALGPRNDRNWSQMMPKKQRRTALLSALSAKFDEGKIIALDTFESTEAKTKQFDEMLHKLPIDKDDLIVLDEKNELIQKSSRNIPYAKTILANYLNIADLQKYDIVLFLEKAVKKAETIFVPNITSQN